MDIHGLSPFTPGLHEDPEINPTIRRKAKVVPDFQNELSGKEEGVDELVNVVDETQHNLAR